MEEQREFSIYTQVVNVCSTVKVMCKNRTKAFSEEPKSVDTNILPVHWLCLSLSLIDKYTEHQHYWIL